jgi:hypothetical protein
MRSQSISAQISSKKVQVGVPFEFAVVITGATGSFTQPTFKDFDIVSGPNQSSSVQYVNGVMSQQVVFSYGLVARKEGKFVIGAATAVVAGQRMESQPIVVEAVKGAAGAQGGAEGESRASGNDIFIKTTISKNKCYVGEQVVIVQKVYSRYQIIGYQKSVQPSYDGFYSQPQESPTKGQLIMENVDGVNYFTHEVLRTLATANKSGKISLTPMEADVVVRRQTATKARNIFEQFFGAAGYEDVPVHAVSRPAVVEVMPLPEAGKPENFSGAVGVFTSKVEATRNEMKANEAFNLRMTISGKGNIRLINAPTLDLPDAFETYEPKTSETPTSKTFEYLIIPRQEGEFELKGLDFTYFNLDSKKYVTLPAPQLKIKVHAADPNSIGTQVYTPQSQVKETENDIRYIKKGNIVLSKTDSEFFNSPLHLSLIALALVGLAVALIVRNNYIKNNSNVALVRERKAASLARKKLTNAEKMMQANNKDAFYTEVLLALNNYLSYRLHIPVSELSKENIQSVINSKKVDAAVSTKLFSTLNNSEYAKYAPGAVSGDLRAVYNDTISLITEMEEQLNKKPA